MNFTEIFQGAFSFSQFFLLGLVYLFVFIKIYVKVTPYDEIALIKNGNLAASLSLLGATIGFLLPMASVITHTHLINDMAIWSLISMIVQLLSFQAIKMIWMPDVQEKIESGNVACGVFLLTLSLAVGLINAVSMS